MGDGASAANVFGAFDPPIREPPRVLSRGGSLSWDQILVLSPFVNAVGLVEVGCGAVKDLDWGGIAVRVCAVDVDRVSGTGRREWRGDGTMDNKDVTEIPNGKVEATGVARDNGRRDGGKSRWAKAAAGSGAGGGFLEPIGLFHNLSIAHTRLICLS